MPSALSVAAATIPAIAVPWPFGSVPPSPEPLTKSVPANTFPARSGCEASTPVSRIATTELPAGVTVPWTSSHAIRGSDHCSAYLGSSGAPAVSRERSASTATTDESARRAATDASSALTEYIRSGAIGSPAVAPAELIASTWSASEVPGAKVTMYGATEWPLVVVAAELVASVVVADVSDDVEEPVKAASGASGSPPASAPEVSNPTVRRTAIPAAYFA